MKACFLRAAAAAAAMGVFGAVSTASAQAESEVILRAEMPFDSCPGKIGRLLSRLGADEPNVHVTRDTGAHYAVKLVAASANLEFLCNAVTETIEVTRTTPGELEVAAH